MPFSPSNFIDADVASRAVSSGQQGTENLLRLQRELQRADAENAFESQANPFKLGILEQNLSKFQRDNRIGDATESSTIEATNIANQLSVDLAPITLSDRQLNNRNNQLNVVSNEAAVRSQLDAFVREPDTRAQSEFDTRQAIEAAGGSTAGRPQISFEGQSAGGQPRDAGGRDHDRLG